MYRSTGRKLEDPDLLESIRLTIINNLLKYHPESSARLAMGEAFGIQAPDKKLDVDIATHIHVKNDGPKRSLLCIETEDRPGLLLEVIKIMADVNITMESAEIDTEGLVAKDKFHVSYRGAALNDSLSQVLTNCLRYYLRKSLDVDIATHIHVKNDGPKRSLLCIETEDRPGLLLEVIKIMADVNITVESAEIDTEGLVAKDKFHVSYRGAALNDSLSQVLTNCLRYYLRKSV
ncbi:ACT domain-containing protein [Artemisia annua]|uniref:ACT domain-containing protein ACR n=1 Tax=Artemisia annua TaxID=35608 RepID=A0A2U1KRJ1_ARTAN|nr:ACT domain-containing protein [Artemisia annua]